MKKLNKPKVSFNAPVTLTFVIVCFVALVINYITGGFTNNLLFSVYRSSLVSPFTYLRFFGHAIGHADWSHLLGNMMLILILGPLLEEKYGSSNMLMVIALTAFATGLASFIIFPDVQLLGASGVVFALILLSSFTSVEEGSIPLTFILVAVLYIGEQIYQGVFIDDDVSNFTHILGGVCGAVLGYYLNKGKLRKSGSGDNTVNTMSVTNGNSMYY
ncbi:MAG: rhomboid family intramembrane serine protease [Acutalibacteraceae bacterium]|nr:rhomboid family intramembrane serine protease [Clostridia bacterium]MEE3449364.1 rhomboid family intramembrane serine protease [Acutalibacteraceae bacterium]